jgi:hypothetical protein
MPRKHPYLAPDEAALLAVFDPCAEWTRSSLSQLLSASATPITPSASKRFASVLALGDSHLKANSPWTADPRVTEDVLLLRLRKFSEGNAAPRIREAAEAENLAVFDFITERVFAPEPEQYRFETGDWTVGTDPATLYAGCFVLHSTFGKGRLLDIGDYKGMDTFVIKFADRGRLINVEYGLPHLRRLAAEKHDKAG